MPDEYVGYDYFAEKLGILISSVRVAVHTKGRFPGFPAPVNPGSRSPKFRRTEADDWIAEHLERRGARRGRPRTTTDTQTVKAAPPLRVDPNELVGYDYIANSLQLPLKTIYRIASPNDVLHDARFPRAITPPGDRQPKFYRHEADAFINIRRPRSRRARAR